MKIVIFLLLSFNSCLLYSQVSRYSKPFRASPYEQPFDLGLYERKINERQNQYNLNLSDLYVARKDIETQLTYVENPNYNLILIYYKAVVEWGNDLDVSQTKIRNDYMIRLNAISTAINFCIEYPQFTLPNDYFIYLENEFRK